MTRQRNPLRWAFGLLAVACATAALWAPLAPVAHADPAGDAVAAVDQAWTAAGGDTSPLGPKVGGIYPAGAGFGQDFVNGAIFFSPDTGAHSVFGAILEKYRSLGGPGDGDLGFPTIDESPGRVSPDSRNVTFSAPDSPVIFWTPETGAWVVRGVINSAWDKLGGSAGPLGVPVEDETYSGETISQRFTGGQLTYDTAARTFTTTPPELAGQLADLPLPTDDAAWAINLAWRVAGGPQGQLGAKQGDQYPVGDGGAGQNFVGGKIYFSPETGAHVVSGTILEKYEAAGGPTGELGFPTSNEADGDVPGSRVSTFGAPDAPAIVWTPEHGAVIVRGPMKAAWDELGGSGGDLGVPIADQTGDDTITQNFSGGQVTYNTKNNTFSTQPPELAERLAGLDLPQQTTPTPSAAPSAAQDSDDQTDGSGWKSWYLWVIIGIAVLLLASLAAFLASRRRRGAVQDRSHDGLADDDFHDDFRGDVGRDRDGHERDDRGGWTSAGGGQGSGPTRFDERGPDDSDYLAAQQPRTQSDAGPRSWSEPEVPTAGMAVNAAGPELFTHHGAHEAETDDSDPDTVDTAPTPVQSDTGEPSGRHAAASDEFRPPWLSQDDAAVPGPNSLFAPVYGAAPPPSASPDHDEPASEDRPDFERNFGRTDYGQSESGQADYAEIDYERADYEEYGQPVADSDSASSAYDEPKYDEPASATSLDDQPSAPDSAPPPPAIHLPLEDPDEAPEGYPVKGSMRTGTYHAPGSASYDVTVAEIWFSSEESAEANGFTRAE
ncbi:LGFP repeat-containing protein [Mycolicibacterium mengxianglii]|uniref:LGFP repeat-containing protein n=1 Tax=Mycolicibacterium mengxianglii TaxID=2736649 RepID=UPI0018D0B4B1|nr:hypothetical protein [Mycolicibacterium mengxianglii]